MLLGLHLHSIRNPFSRHLSQCLITSAHLSSTKTSRNNPSPSFLALDSAWCILLPIPQYNRDIFGCCYFLLNFVISKVHWSSHCRPDAKGAILPRGLRLSFWTFNAILNIPSSCVLAFLLLSLPLLSLCVGSWPFSYFNATSGVTILFWCLGVFSLVTAFFLLHKQKSKTKVKKKNFKKRREKNIQ